MPLLSFDQARHNPCGGCAAPCCTTLPLYDFRVQRLADIDYALYLLNFDRIEIGLMSDGAWRIYYRARCSHLDPVTSLCDLHGTPRKPRVCQKYDAHACYYKRIFSETGDPVCVRMDRQRLLAWAEHVSFDENRDIVSIPMPTALLSWLPPLEPVEDPPIPGSKMLQTWGAIARGEQAEPELPPRTWAEVQAPCEGCAAWCCTRLSFPHDRPENASQLDHLRFCLGFPGIEVLVDGQDQWSLTVRTRCRHRVETPEGIGRCGIFGQPERPSTCARFDAMTCAYKARFGRPRPQGALRITAETFEAIADGFAFDEAGQVLQRPDLGAMTAAAEAAWAGGGGP